MKDKKISLEINVIITGEYRSAALSIYNLKYSLPKKILTAFDNESNYDFQFIIKEMVEEFKKCFLCVGESTKKIHNFTVPIETEVTRIDKN